MTCAVMLAFMPELGTVKSARRQARRSGTVESRLRKERGKRHIWGGRSAVRSALYMATLSAGASTP